MEKSETDNTEHYLSGKLLLAMPGIGDPRFHRAVIFLCAHDKNGAMGLVINREREDVAFGTLLSQLGITSNIEINPDALALPIMSGGPVESSRGFILHTSDFSRTETITVDGGYSITGTLEALQDLANGSGPDKALFILGYAGWGAGQLEEEIMQNAWLVVDPDEKIVFDAQHGRKWDMAMAKLGFNPQMLSSQSGRA